MPLAKGTKPGPYEIQSLLGSGGIGKAYRVRDMRLDRAVAGAARAWFCGRTEEDWIMTKLGRLALCLMVAAVICVAQDVVSVVHGTVTKVDSSTKTVAVKSADGTEHTIKVTGDTAYKGTKDGFDGLKEGTEVVARTTGKGAEETGVEIGKVGKDSLNVTKGTITKVDEGTKTVVVKTADGTEKTFEYTGNAGKDMGKAVGKGAEKSAKVTVYYTDEAGKKIAHFFRF